MGGNGVLKYLVVLLCLIVLSGCSLTRRLPEGDYLLVRNKVKEDKELAKRDRIRTTHIERFMQPKPNRRFLGTNFYLQTYNLANPDTTRKGFFNRLFRRIGDPPILLDSLLVERSAEYIQNYAVYGGFYDARTSFSVETTRKQKAKVTYTIKQNKPYRIGEIKYDFRDKFMRPIIMQDSVNTLLRSGDILDGNVLSNERMRVVNFLKDNGYYAYTLNNIEFVGDSTVGDRKVDLTIQLKQNLEDYDSKGEPIYANNSIYRLKNIYINPDYDAMKAASDPDYYKRMDTTEYRGLYIIHPEGERPKVRHKILRKSVNIYPNYIYSATDVRDAYSNLIRLGYFKNANIIFDEPSVDTLEQGELTYVGDEGSGQTTSERLLSCHINCIRAHTHSYKIELEGTTSSNFYGITATIGYQNRNLLRGAELFDVSLTGGYEFMRTKGLKGSFEIGGAMSLTFPRFVAPFNIDRFNRRVNPRTKVEVSINSQKRPKYHRTLSSVGWSYSWSNRHKSSFIFRPIDINLIRMNSVDEDFLNSMGNTYLKKSFENKLVPGISGAYIYNTQAGLTSVYTNSLYFRFNWETAGNLMRLMGKAFLPRHIDSDTDLRYYKILGIQFAQYFRVDASISNKFMLGAKSNIAYRIHAGVGRAYGNDVTLPYDRQFYAGGSNSMRGWIARTLGPGSSPSLSDYPSQTGNMKLEANAELRFPVWGIFHGALFFDLGNVWFLSDMESYDEKGVFKINRFYKELGFNTGLGFRFDIGMAILRFDWGIPLHNPNLPSGERWINKFRFSNTALNFGVGYPF